jgi:pimeloyl-ACP methyl ester carboxylesterase
MAAADDDAIESLWINHSHGASILGAAAGQPPAWAWLCPHCTSNCAAMLARHIPVLLCLSALGWAETAAAIEESECRIGLRGGEKVLAQCATLWVPADPDDPDGEQLELAVTRIPALAATPLPDPITLIQGGPGGSSIDLYLSMRGALTGLRRNRDVIVMDQRGTGRSMAGLSCESPDDVNFQVAGPEMIRDLLDACLAQIERDPRFYTTSLAVRDLEALREAYAIESWNIYGVSYGTRVAQHYVRRYPDRVRSVILDGSLPAATVLGPYIAVAMQDAFDEILARCEQDSGCSARFGDVKRKFAELRERLATEDIRVGRVDRDTGETYEVPLTIDVLNGLTRLMSYSSTTAALLPLTIDEAHAGRYGALVNQAELVFTQLDNSLNIAMHNNVICSEDWPRFDPANAPDTSATFIGDVMIAGFETICSLWPAGPVDPDFSAPLHTDVPVLFMSGSADPATPAEFVDEIIAGGVLNAAHIVVEDEGHGVFGIGCMPRIAESFIDAASPDELDTECIEAVIPMPFFLTPAGPAP